MTHPALREDVVTHPALRAEPQRRSLVVKIAFVLLLYVLYAAFAWWAETAARLHFRVPSKAEVASITERVAHLHAESARDRALADMADWTPYAAWSIFVTVLMFAALAGSIAAGVWLAISMVRTSGVGSIKLVAVGFVGLMAVAVGAVIAPPLVSEAAYETRATHFAPGP